MGFVEVRKDFMIRREGAMFLIAIFMRYSLVMLVWPKSRNIVGWEARVGFGEFKYIYVLYQILYNS